MSKALGVGVFAVGLGVLGWWATSHNAHRIEAQISAAASSAVAESVHGAVTTVSGRDIRLSGVIDGPTEEASLMAALNAVSGRRVVTEDITLLPVVAPFTLDVVKDGGLTATGNVATEALRGDLGLGDQAAGLMLAAGAPADWGDLAKAGIAALGPMTEGSMALSDSTLTLTGTALGPDEAAAIDAALASLPAGSVQKDITLLDDGTPAAYQFDYTAAAGAKISGKLPKGVDLAAIAQAIGLGAVAGEVKTALIGADGTVAGFAAFKDWMDRIESLTIISDGTAVRAEAQMALDSDAQALSASLATAGIDAVVKVAPASGANGDTRVNAATGAKQRFMGGYWLGVPQVDLTLGGCQAAAETVLGRSTISFVSGSDALDTSAVAVINELGGIMARCSEEAGLSAVIGGYTDSSGDPVANLGLSQRRAVAVRRELIARGVAGAALKAVGHGDADPIADNSTEDGRAQNRRTTITWSE